jgi:hypothetical protein
MTIADRIKADLLAARPKPVLAECLQCGRGINPANAAAGGRGRFCSDRCMDYFDAGWDARRGPKGAIPDPGAKTASYTPKSASGRSRSEAGKHRWQVKRKQDLAESWRKYQAKGVKNDQAQT